MQTCISPPYTASGHTESHPAFRALLGLVTAIRLCSVAAGRLPTGNFAQPRCITKHTCTLYFGTMVAQYCHVLHNMRCYGPTQAAEEADAAYCKCRQSLKFGAATCPSLCVWHPHSTGLPCLPVNWQAPDAGQHPRAPSFACRQRFD